MARRPKRSVGALLINPRRRKTTRRRRPSTKRRRVVRVNRRKSAKRRVTRRKSTARRRAPARRRRNPRKARTRAASKVKYVYRKKNPRRRKAAKRKSNPGVLSQWARFVGKIPVVGNLLLPLPVAAVGGIAGIEGSLFLGPFIARFLPFVPASLMYVASGAVSSAVIRMVSRKLGASAATADKLAIGTFSATLGAAYLQWRTGQDKPAAEEMGALVLNGYGNPFASALLGDAGLGELVALGGYGGAYAGHYGAAGPMSVQPIGAAL